MTDLAELKTAITDYQAATAEALTQTTSDVKALSDELDKIQMRLNRPGAMGMHRSVAGDLEKRALVKWIRHGGERLDYDEQKALQVTPDTAGGYLAPDRFVRELLRNVVLFSPIRSVARVQEVSAGTAVLPKRTGGMTAAWVPEVGLRPATTVTFSENRYPVCELAAYIDVSNQLLDDSAFDIASELAFEFAEEFGRAEGASFVNGSGTLQPQGLM